MEADFLRHILENPEDLTARRVFADWLAEQPEQERRDRGEFITLQCELAGKVTPGSRRRAMEDRAGELLARYGETWAAPIRPLVKGYTFRHGMIESVRIDVLTFCADGEELLRRAPVTELGILPATPSYERRWEELRDLVEAPFLSRIVSLDFSRCYVNGDALAHLLQSPHLTRLRRLNLDNCPVGDEGILALTGSPYFGQLTHLSLVRSRVRTEGIRLLLQDPDNHLERLRLQAWSGFPPLRAWELLDALRVIQEPLAFRRSRRLLADLENCLRPGRCRDLLQNASAHLVDVLCRTLNHSNAKVRALAVTEFPHALQSVLKYNPQWRSGAPAAVPPLIRRCFSELPRASVNAALQAVSHQFSPPLQQWLSTLTEGTSAAQALERSVVNGALALPDAVRQEFAELCLRRARWRAGHGRARGKGSEEVIEMLAGLAREAYTQRSALRELVLLVTQLAVEAAVRHADPGLSPERAEAVRTRARERESAWLASWLFQLLQQHPPAAGRRE